MMDLADKRIFKQVVIDRLVELNNMLPDCRYSKLKESEIKGKISAFEDMITIIEEYTVPK